MTSTLDGADSAASANGQAGLIVLNADIAPLRAVANRCTAGSCPTIYASGTGTVVVQGFTVTAERAGIDVPDGEALVEIPHEILAEALRNLS